MANWVKAFLENNPDKTDKIVKRAKYALHTRNDDGTVTAYITGMPMHYQDEQGKWQPLDTAIKQLEDGLLGAKGIPIRLDDQGKVRIFNSLGKDVYSQVTSKIAVYNSDTDKIIETFNLPIGKINDDKLIKENNLYKHVLTLKETGLREELIIKNKPKQLVNKDNLWLVLDTVVTDINFDDGWIDKEYSKEKFKFVLPKAKDANNKEAYPKRYAKKINGKQHIFTGLKFSELYQANYPVTIDPDFISGTKDKYIYGNNTTYSVARSSSYGENDTAIYIAIGQSRFLYYGVFRGFLLFDTSSITGAVTQVNLALTVYQDLSDIDFDVQIVKQDWSDQKQEDAYDGCLSGIQDNNIWRNTSGISTNTQYTSGNLSTSWVDTSGTTYYSLRSSRDKNNNEPTGSEYIDVYSADESTSSYRPTLTVTYSEGIATRKTLLGVGI